MNTTLALSSLHLHPVKSCAGIAVNEALLIETGFEFDRAWMVVDRDGVFVTQRQLPRMALIQPTLRASDLVLRAPGMLAMHLRLDAVEGRCRVRVHADEIDAFDMGDLAAQWFSDFLGRPVRLARFDPDVRRPPDRSWVGDLDATTGFADAYALLVASTASLAELNRRLAADGHEPVTKERFRPNLVLDGLDDAHGEDFIDTLAIDSPDGEVVLKLVKPCTRCSIPDVDPRTGEPGHAVGDALRGYRADPRMDGRLTFGQNAVILSGFEHRLRVGAAVRATLAF
jgi:uncharacterized protein YcbX